MRLLELTLERDNAEGCEAPAEPHRAAALAKAMAAARAGGCGTGASSLGLDLSTPHSILYDLLSPGSLQEGFFFLSLPPLSGSTSRRSQLRLNSADGAPSTRRWLIH